MASSNYKVSIPVNKCGNHWHFSRSKYDERPRNISGHVLYARTPSYKRQAPVSGGGPLTDDDPGGPEQVYARGGHAIDSRPYIVDSWLESGFCTLMTQERVVLKCPGRPEWEEDQLFRREDLSSKPWSGETGKGAPPGYDVAAASFEAGRPPAYEPSSSRTGGGEKRR